MQPIIISIGLPSIGGDGHIIPIMANIIYAKMNAAIPKRLPRRSLLPIPFTIIYLAKKRKSINNAKSCKNSSGGGR